MYKFGEHDALGGLLRWNRPHIHHGSDGPVRQRRPVVGFDQIPADWADYPVALRIAQPRNECEITCGVNPSSVWRAAHVALLVVLSHWPSPAPVAWRPGDIPAWFWWSGPYRLGS